MYIEELAKLDQWIKENVVENGVETKYQALYEAVNLNVNSPSSTPFLNEKNELFEEIGIIEYHDLTLEQINLLDRMGLKKLFGEMGKSNINSYLKENSSDIASIANFLGECCNTIANGKAYLNTLSIKLKEYFVCNKSEEIKDDETLIRVYFEDGAAIKTLENLKEQGSNWDLIGRGIAAATDVRPEDIRIISAEKGSVIINLVTVTAVAAVISKIIREAFEITQKIYDVKKIKLECEKLNLEKREIEDMLAEEIKDTKEKGANQILETMCKELKIDKKDGEKRSNLSKAITLLLNFANEGGKLDFIHNEIAEANSEGENDSNEELKKLRIEINKLDSNVEEIRRLERYTKLLK